MGKTISIRGLDKAAVLAALYNASKQQGFGLRNEAGKKDLTVDEARQYVDGRDQLSFDYLRGRVMKVDITGNDLYPDLYDRDNGPGAAEAALAELLANRIESSEVEEHTSAEWAKPKPVDPVNFAFPANVIGKFLPRMADIPEEFKDRHNPWCDVVQTLFFKGGELPATKPGVNAGAAYKHLYTVLRSFEPQHEHKIAGAAWLMSMWYEQPVLV